MPPFAVRPIIVILYLNMVQVGWEEYGGYTQTTDWWK